MGVQAGPRSFVGRVVLAALSGAVPLLPVVLA